MGCNGTRMGCRWADLRASDSFSKFWSFSRSKFLKKRVRGSKIGPCNVHFGPAGSAKVGRFSQFWRILRQNRKISILRQNCDSNGEIIGLFLRKIAKQWSKHWLCDFGAQTKSPDPGFGQMPIFAWYPCQNPAKIENTWAHLRTFGVWSRKRPSKMADFDRFWHYLRL